MSRACSSDVVAFIVDVSRVRLSANEDQHLAYVTHLLGCIRSSLLLHAQLTYSRAVGVLHVVRLLHRFSTLYTHSRSAV